MSTNAEHDACLVMETVAELHGRGYGRLKLFSYIKEGLGAWRHWFFAGDTFPTQSSDIPEPFVHGSIPWLTTPTVSGTSPSDAADRFIIAHPDLMARANGYDDVYVPWYGELLASGVQGVLEMESPMEARFGSRKVPTPYVDSK